MSEPTRIKMFGRWHPGPGSRVEGVTGSARLGGRRGLILRRHETNKAVVIVRWDGLTERGKVDEEGVVISLLRDEPLLDQMSRIYEEE